MKNLKEFQEKKSKILSAYEEVKKLDILPIKYDNNILDIETIDEYIKNLTEEKFILSVCGQIKVGKSTFLNDLIFEDLILPTASTPETAKLTELSYGEKLSIEVFFYTKEEFQVIKSQKMKDEKTGQDSTYEELFLKPQLREITKLTGSPVFPDQILSKKNELLNNFESLKEYVSAKGIFTPFVKLVKIKYPSDLLKEVTIVDTPGTNDPNIMRAKVTEEWIGKSDATIFLMFAGQALSIQDVRFMQDYLISIPSEKIVIGLSKIDAVEDYSRAYEYVKSSLQENMSEFSKNINKNNVYSISPMFSLYPKIYEKWNNYEITISKELEEDLNFQLNNRGEEKNIKEIIANKGFMNEFKIAVESKLIKNKGNDLLLSHTQKIRTIFEYKEKNLKLEKEKLLDKITTINLSENEVKEKMKFIEKNIEEYENISNEFNFKFESIKKNFNFEINNIAHNMSVEIIKKGKEFIDKNTVNYLIQNLSWDIKNNLESYLRSKGKEEMEKVLNTIKHDVDDLQNKIKIKISEFNIFSMTYLNLLFETFDISNIIDSLGNLIKKSLSNLETLKVPNYYFWTNNEATKDNMIESLNSSFNSIKDSMSVISKNEFLKMIDEHLLYKFIPKIREEIGNKDQELRSINENRQKFILQLEPIKIEIEKIDQEILLINQKSKKLFETLE